MTSRAAFKPCGHVVILTSRAPIYCPRCFKGLLTQESLTYHEPPRDSGEADAVHGPTALGTQHDNTRASGARK